MGGSLLLLALALPAVPAAAGPSGAGLVQLAQAENESGGGIRQIAPEVVAPPAVDPGALEREAPRAPLSELGRAGPVQKKPREAAEGQPQVFRPVAVAAGRIEAEGMTIVIAGIDILEPEQTCRGNEGEWPCGMAARTAFRQFLRGRALDCDLPEDALPERLATACRLSGQDLGAWLVANGWAKVSSTGSYSLEQSEAIAGRRGIFGPGPDPLPAAAEQPVATSPSMVPPMDPAPSADGPGNPEPAAPPAADIERAPLPAPKGLY